MKFLDFFTFSVVRLIGGVFSFGSGAPLDRTGKARGGGGGGGLLW